VRSALGGAALLVAVVAPWFVAASRAGVPLALFDYEHAFNLGETLGRHMEPYPYVLRVVAVGSLPWSAAALVGLAVALGRPPDSEARAAAGAWIGAMLFFTLAEAQMGHFYAVIQPAVAVLGAIGVVRLVAGRGLVSVAGLAIFAALAGLAAVVWDDPSTVLETATVKAGLFGVVDLRLPALATMGAWVALLALAGLLRRPGLAVAAAVPPALFVAFLAWWAVPALEPKKSMKPMWDRYLAERRPGEPMGALGERKDGLYYYSNDVFERVRSNVDLQRFLDGPGARYLILPERDFRRLDLRTLGGIQRWEVLDDAHPTHVLVRRREPRPEGGG
jgi:hypothetical protein